MTNIDNRPPGHVDPAYEPPFDPTPEPTDWSLPTNNPVPHDNSAEQYILGAALLDPTQLTACARLLTPRDFWAPRHETIWRSLLHLQATDQPTEPQAVVAHLVDTREITRVGGAPYIHELLTACPIPTSAPYYATRVEGLARRRRAIDELTRGLQRLRAPGDDHDVDEVLNRTTSHLVEARDALANPPTATTWSPVDLSAVLAGEYLDPPPTMLLRNDGVPLLYDGAIHTISGESESGKTWLALLAALEQLQAGNRVAFLDFEDRADRVVGRLLGLGATFEQLRAGFSYIRPDRPLDDDGRAQLAPHLPGYRLVIVDGVTEAMTMHGYDLNANDDAARFYGLLPRWIADHGPAVAMIDHVVKDKEKQGRFALGAQHKLAGIDGVAYLVKTIQPFARGKRGLARITIGKDRPGHVREHAFGSIIAEFSLDATNDLILLAELSPPGEQSGRAGETFEPTILMERISRFVQANPGLSKKAIEDAMNGKTTTKRLAIELLVSHEYIGTKVGKRGAIQHFHNRSYYADPEEDPGYETTDTTGEIA